MIKNQPDGRLGGVLAEQEMKGPQSEDERFRFGF
jgi:hypothetical protein